MMKLERSTCNTIHLILNTPLNPRLPNYFHGYVIYYFMPFEMILRCWQ